MIATEQQKSEWTSPEAVAEWWKSSHQTRFKRSYSPELVVSLRSPFVEVWPSSEQAVKFRGLLDQHAAKGTTSVTIGATDVITSHLMSDAGFETVYVSGSSCSITDNATQDFGADMADYPYETVPNKVKQLFRSQLFQYKNDNVIASKAGSKPGVDRLLPIIADGDTGHGGQTANMKLIKLFVEAGAAGVHVDDQVPGTKKFGAKTSGRVLVPVEEHISRLMSMKLQLDVMGSEMVILHRTDAETAGYITSTISPLDRPHILGVSNPSSGPLQRAVSIAKSKSGAEDLEEQWEKSANLVTLDEAIKKVATPEAYSAFEAKSKGQNVSEALQTAVKLGINVYWDCEAARSREGWYRFRGGIQPAIERAIACANHADILWTRTPATVEEDLTRFAKEVKAAVPGALLAYNLAADVKGSDEEIKNFTNKLGKMGYVWQFMPLAGQTGTAVGVSKVINAMKEEGILGYMKTVSRPNKEQPISVASKIWQGGEVADASVGAVTLW